MECAASSSDPDIALPYRSRRCGSLAAYRQIIDRPREGTSMELTIRILGAGTADQEVIGLDVTVDEVLLMDRLYPGQLYGGEARSGNSEPLGVS